MLNTRTREFILHNALMLPYEELMQKAVKLDENANKNNVSQVVIQMVKKNRLIPCFFNPVRDRYEILPKEFMIKLTKAQAENKKFPSELYRAMRKKAAHSAIQKRVDPLVKNMTESVQEKRNELNQLVAQMADEPTRSTKTFVYLLIASIALCGYIALSWLFGFWPF
jgi:type IV secretory pathway VirB4 component